MPSVLPADTPSLPTSQAGEPTTITQTSSATDSPSSTGIPGVKGKSFLENKPLSGFVFGLSGLVFLILVFVIVTSFMRRRNRKRLLADASNFSFDPRDVEDGASDEKYSHSGLVNQHSIGHGHNDYPLDGRVATAIGGGSISRSGPSHSPPMPNYIPQDYGSYDGSYLAQYHNMGNVPVGYNPTPNPYDMYGPRNGGVYPNGRVHHDPYNLSGPNGGNFSEPDSDHSVPRQLHPGVRPAQGPTFSPRLSNNALSYQAPPIASTTPAPAPPYLQSSVSDKDDIARLPTPNFLPDTFGQQDSVDSVDDAYGGVFLGPESPPEQRTLQVGWRSTSGVMCRH